MARLSDILGPSGLASKDGDILDVGFTPANYTPDASPAEAQDADDLAAHLKGLDTEIGSLATEVASLNAGLASAGGAWEFISSTEITTNVTSVDITAFDSAKYDDYVFFVDYLRSDSNNLSLRFSSDGGASFDEATNYYFTLLQLEHGDASPSGYSNSGNAAPSILLSERYVRSITSVITIHSPHKAAVTRVTHQGWGDYVVTVIGAGRHNLSSDVNAIRFSTPSGTLTDGAIHMYGVKRT